jgi:hypothetical protein
MTKADTPAMRTLAPLAPTDFISDYERNGAYTGFPGLGIEW